MCLIEIFVLDETFVMAFLVYRSQQAMKSNKAYIPQVMGWILLDLVRHGNGGERDDCCDGARCGKCPRRPGAQRKNSYEKCF